MKISVSSPATIFDMAALAPVMSQLHWRIAKEMWHGGDTFAFKAGEALIALGGFYPLDPQHTDAEAWFMAAPAARPHMPGLARAMRLTILDSPYRSITAICRSEEGKRLARVLGFRPEGQRQIGAMMAEVWTYGADFIAFRGRELGRGRPGAGEPAA